MKNFIIKHQTLILVFSLFLIITSYNQESKLTEEEKVLQIKQSLDKTEKGIIEINKILDDPYYKHQIK